MKNRCEFDIDEDAFLKMVHAIIHGQQLVPHVVTGYVSLSGNTFGVRLEIKEIWAVDKEV